MRLSLARRFWNQILIWVSVNCNRSANSKRRPREIYSLRWNSTSKRMVCSLLNVVRCRLGRPSFRRRRATMQIIRTRTHRNEKRREWGKIKQFSISQFQCEHDFFFSTNLYDSFQLSFIYFENILPLHTVGNTHTKIKDSDFEHNLSGVFVF